MFGPGWSSDVSTVLLALVWAMCIYTIYIVIVFIMIYSKTDYDFLCMHVYLHTCTYCTYINAFIFIYTYYVLDPDSTMILGVSIPVSTDSGCPAK